MKIPTPQPLDPDTLMAQLQQALPEYKFTKRTKKFFVAEKTAAVGANVVVNNNKVAVVPNFPNMGLQMVFILCVVFLGILIPLIVYFVTVHGKQKAAAAEVGGVIEQIVAGHPVGMQQGYAAQAYQQPQLGQAPMGQAPVGQAPMGQPQAAFAQQPQPGYGQPQPNYGQPPAAY